ncbi:MAG TPA: YeeE/YedE family protein [Nitrospirae bacterium]|nr:YeeE/YedE family protein [Nitrospirota bacterium]
MLGLVTGILFGILLHKGQVTKYHKIVGQFLLTDFTVLKVMLSAIVVGSIGIYLLVGINAAQLHIKPLLMGAVISGAVIFGVGMAVLGYCPGTCVAAIGNGRIDALAGGIFGGIVGAGLYAHFYPFFKDTVLRWGVFGKLTFPQTLNASPWIIIAILVVLSLIIFIIVSNYEKRIKV